MADPTVFDEEVFLERRKSQEASHRRAIGGRHNVMDSLIAVEPNITELCNRKCVFCPRIDPHVYPNRNLHMSMEVAERVAQDLADAGSRCRISLSGFGEPLLHPAFDQVVQAFRSRLPYNAIEMNTNGDRLTAETLRRLYGAGLTTLYVNCYDGPEQVKPFADLFAGAGIPTTRYFLRKHWGEASDFGLVLNNRSGTVNLAAAGVEPLTAPLARQCFYPFYKMLIDWNGDVLFCSNDWGRTIVIGNVMKESIRSLWLSEAMRNIRKRLMLGDRSQKPCNTCSVGGTLHGRSSFEQIVAHYAEEEAGASTRLRDTN